MKYHQQHSYLFLCDLIEFEQFVHYLELLLNAKPFYSKNKYDISFKNLIGNKISKYKFKCNKSETMKM